MSTKPPIQKFLPGILHPEDESKQNLRAWKVLNHRKRKDK
jgi:hypothetical protein